MKNIVKTMLKLILTVSLIWIGLCVMSVASVAAGLIFGPIASTVVFWMFIVVAAGGILKLIHKKAE